MVYKLFIICFKYTDRTSELWREKVKTTNGELQSCTWTLASFVIRISTYWKELRYFYKVYTQSMYFAHFLGIELSKPK